MPCIPYDPNASVDPNATRPASTSLEVPAEKTPVSTSDFVAALSKAFASYTGQAPSTFQIAALYGQWALETASGSAMYNNAVGNVIATGSQPYFLLWTGIPGMYRKDGVCGEGWKKFRAFDTLALGLQSWLALFGSSGSRYSKAWQLLLNDQGSALDVIKGFAQAVVDAGYIGLNAAASDKANYVNGVLNNANTYLKSLGQPIPAASLWVAKYGWYVTLAVSAGVVGLGTAYFKFWRK